MWGHYSLRAMIFQDDKDANDGNDVTWMFCLGVLALILLLILFFTWKGCRNLKTKTTQVISPKKGLKQSK